MKKNIISSILFLSILFFGAWGTGCAPTHAIAAKSGAQLWGENCIRCHNTPPPNQFNDREWSTIGSHMGIVGNLTQDETTKIVAFLKTGN